MSGFMNTSINESPVIGANAGAEIVNGAHRAVRFDGNGQAVLADAGSMPFGVLIGSTEPHIPIGGDLAVMVKDMGYIVAEGDIAVGDALSVASGGAAVKAQTGSFILGYAFSKGEADDLILIQVTKSGYMS